MAWPRALLAGLVAAGLHTLAVRADNAIADDAYFYGQSPPVYLSRESAPALVAAARAHPLAPSRSRDGWEGVGRRL